MRNHKLIIVFCMVFLFAGNVAFAAQIRGIVDKSTNRIWISISGDIEPGDARKFKDLVLEMRQSSEIIREVKLASNGGDVVEAMKIGEIIRDLFCTTMAPHNYKYGITCSMHSSNLEDKAHVEHINRNCNCASACFLIWAAGVNRRGDVLGLHRPRFSKDYFKGLSAEEAKDKYRDLSNGVRAYLQKMDIPNHIIEKMFEYSSEEIFYLEPDTAYSLRLAPFFEEWLIANCNPLTDEEARDLSGFITKKSKNLSRAEKFYSKSLFKKSGEYGMCYSKKIRETQNNIFLFDLEFPDKPTK